MTRVLVMVLALVPGVTVATAIQVPETGTGAADLLRAQVGAQLEAVAARVEGVVAFSIVDLTTGERWDRHAELVLPTASVIKLAILYELFRQADERKIVLDHPQALDRSRAVPGGLLYELGTPALSLRDLAVAMIVLSDNTATNVLIERVGMAAVNERLRSLGLTETRLRRYMIDLDAARRGDENVSTTGEIARLLVLLHEGHGLQPATAEAMRGVLRRTKGGPLASGIPPGTAVASKSGSLEGVRADTGIVYLEGRPYVFVAMTSFLQDEQGADRAITDLSRLAFGYFERLAVSSGLGRRLR